MKCKNCGYSNEKNTDKCEFCGAVLNELNIDENKDDKDNIESAQENQNEEKNNDNNKKPMPMKWYKFLVLITLPVGAFSNFIEGFSLLMNPSADIETLEYLKNVSNSLYERLNIFYGICIILVSIFMVYSWNNLMKFKKNSLLCIQTIYISNAIISCVYSFLLGYLIGLENFLPMGMSIFFSMITSLFMVIVNTIYFKKRAHLFKN